MAKLGLTRVAPPTRDTPGQNVFLSLGFYSLPGMGLAEGKFKSLDEETLRRSGLVGHAYDPSTQEAGSGWDSVSK